MRGSAQESKAGLVFYEGFSRWVFPSSAMPSKVHNLRAQQSRGKQSGLGLVSGSLPVGFPIECTAGYRLELQISVKHGNGGHRKAKRVWDFRVSFPVGLPPNAAGRSSRQGIAKHWNGKQSGLGLVSGSLPVGLPPTAGYRKAGQSIETQCKGTESKAGLVFSRGLLPVGLPPNAKHGTVEQGKGQYGRARQCG